MERQVTVNSVKSQDTVAEDLDTVNKRTMLEMA